MRGLVAGIIIVVNFILQATLYQHISILGVKPDMAIAVVVTLAIMFGRDRGAVVGFATGMLQDVMFGKPIGIGALSYMLVGYLVGINSEKIFKENLIVPAVFTAGATLFRHGIAIFFYYAVNIEIPFLSYLWNIVLVEAVYNSIVSILVYKVLHMIFSKKLVEEGLKIRKGR